MSATDRSSRQLSNSGRARMRSAVRASLLAMPLALAVEPVAEATNSTRACHAAARSRDGHAVRDELDLALGEAWSRRSSSSTAATWCSRTTRLA